MKMITKSSIEEHLHYSVKDPPFSFKGNEKLGISGITAIDLERLLFVPRYITLNELYIKLSDKEACFKWNRKYQTFVPSPFQAAKGR